MVASADARDLYKSILLRNSLAPSLNKARSGGIAKLLAAVGESDNNIGGLFGKANFFGETTLPASGQDRSAIQQAHDSMLVDTAEGAFLTSLGANYGVPRPPQSPFDDTLYRKMIQILAWLPKTPMLVPYRLAEAIFGTQAALIVAYDRAWAFYEVNPNEIIFECPLELIQGDNAIASYMHGYSGSAASTGGPSNTFTNLGTNANLAASGSTVVGRTCYLFHTGVWNTYTITSCIYDAVLKKNTFQVSVASIPLLNGTPFFIDIPGANAFPGDFMLANASLAADAPLPSDTPPSASLVYLFGQARLDILAFYLNNFARASGVVLRTEVL